MERLAAHAVAGRWNRPACGRGYSAKGWVQARTSADDEHTTGVIMALTCWNAVLGVMGSCYHRRSTASSPKRGVQSLGEPTASAIPGSTQTTRRSGRSSQVQEDTMRYLQSTIVINAEPHAVWQVLTNLDSYPQWNPFITSISGSLEPGGRLRVRISPPGGRAMTFRPVVTEVERARSSSGSREPDCRGSSTAATGSCSQPSTAAQASPRARRSPGSRSVSLAGRCNAPSPGSPR